MSLRGFLHRLLAISVFAGVVAAQTPLATPSSNAAVPPILPAGTAIRLHNMSGLASALARAGDSVSFEVVEPIESAGVVIIPKHAIATGKIVKSEHSHWGGRSGHLAIDIEKVQTITGAPIKVRPFIEPKKNSGQKTSVGDVAGGVVAGILILPILIAAAPSALIAPGAEKWIPPGTDFTVQTIDPVQLDIPALTQWQRKDPFAAAYAEIVFYRPAASRDDDQMSWKVNCGGDQVANLDEKHFVRFFLPVGDYWFKTEGRTIAIEKKELPKSLSVHLAPNSQYVFAFTTWKGNLFAKGPHGYIQEPQVDVGEARFSQLEAGLIFETKRDDTEVESGSLACSWKEGQPFSAQRRNGFAVIDGTPIELLLMQDWSSATAKHGDKVSFALVHDLEVRGVPILKEGFVVDGIMSVPYFVRPEKYTGKYDLMIPNFTLPDGQRVNVRTAKWQLNPFSRYDGEPFFRIDGATIVSGSGVNYVESPYVVKKGSVVQLTKGTVVTIYVEDNYLLDPAQMAQKTPVEAADAIH